jgi:hypothetical protein
MMPFKIRHLETGTDSVVLKESIIGSKHKFYLCACIKSKKLHYLKEDKLLEKYKFMGLAGPSDRKGWSG